MTSTTTFTRVETTSHVISLEAFHGILWTGFVICLIAFAFRLYIRYHCFQKLLIDDWIMMFALTLLLTVVALGQAFLGDVYTVVDFENGDKIPDASFPDTLLKALRGFGASLTVALVGILAVKINFLLFFKRLGTQITMYLVFWYIVLFITVACGAINIGLMDYKCVFGELSYTLSKCIRRSTIKRYFVFQKVSVILDVISDFFIICFPVLILWNVRIGLRKKIILSCTFGLVALTIAVTIVRGSVFGGTYKSFDKNENRNLNMGWMWFWIFIEFSVAFLAACIISFRALFAQRENRSYAREAQLREAAWQARQATPPSNGVVKSNLFWKVRNIHHSLLDSLKTMETGYDFQLPVPESGRMSLTFLTEIETSHTAKEV